jgi:hypothetical protein
MSDHRPDSDWLGTARKPQGTCEPPKVKRNNILRYSVRCGAQCFVKRVSSPGKWKPWTTTKLCTFDRYENRTKEGDFVFRQDGFLLMARWQDVKNEHKHTRTLSVLTVDGKPV